MYNPLNPYQRETYDTREVLESKCVMSFRDDTVVFKGYIKKKDYDGKVFWDYFREDNVPKGWYKRKEYEYFYHPTMGTLENVLLFRHKVRPELGFHRSFIIWLYVKIKEYRDCQEGLAKVKDLKLTEPEAIKALPDLYQKKVPDFLHQKIASYYSYYLPQCGLLEEQGLGKTKTAIETYLAKKNELDLVDRCLVIAPLSVLGDMEWIKQIKTYSDRASFVLVRGTRENKLAILNGEFGIFDFYLINYEGLPAIEEEILEWVDNRTMVIIDETSKIKNYAADRTKLCIKIGSRTHYKMVLTGTPITQGARDIFTQWLFLDGGDTFGNSQERFDDAYFFKQGYRFIPRHNALQEISDKIFRKAVRFTKSEALDIPEKTYQQRIVDMTPLQEQYYKAILAREIIRLESLEKVDAPNVLVTILRLQQITSGFLSTKDEDGNPLGIKPIQGGNPKLSELENLLEEQGDYPFVIWSRFKYDVQNICRLLERKHITYVTYIGGLNPAVRNENERKFVEGEVQAFVSIPSAGGMGMNLQRAHTAIYFSNDYSLQNRLQSEDRVHRMGQTSKVTIIDILCNKSIDIMVLAVLAAKKNVADIVTGDYRKILQNMSQEDIDRLMKNMNGGNGNGY